METRYAGLDFGTSNSSIGTVEDGRAFLVEDESGSSSVPSAVFYSREDGRTLFGRAAIESYRLGDEGRLLRSMKSVLGTSLMDSGTTIGRERKRFDEIIGSFVGHLRDRLVERCGALPPAIVVGRPVRFVDEDDAADAAAEASLEAIVRAQGFEEVGFQLEPIAAALAHERSVRAEERVFVVDIGGGTADFSIVRISPERADVIERRDDVLATAGVHVGGTDFDTRLSLASAMPALGHGGRHAASGRTLPSRLYVDLATWHRIDSLYTPAVLHELGTLAAEAAEPERVRRAVEVVRGRRGHALASAVEAAKIRLSSAPESVIELELADGALRAPTDRATFEAAVGAEMGRIGAAIDETLRRAQLRPADIDTVFLTGGSSSVPILGTTVAARLPGAAIVRGDTFGSVGLGLVLDARRRFGRAPRRSAVG